MVEVSVVYEGALSTRARHGPSGSELTTDAPRDNEGRGGAFSPTDLVAAALGSCMLTIMGILARRRGLALEGTRVRVAKHMVEDPGRRIGRLDVEFRMPPGLPPEARRALEQAALACPVRRSLSPQVEVPVRFLYPEDAERGMVGVHPPTQGGPPC